MSKLLRARTAVLVMAVFIFGFTGMANAQPKPTLDKSYTLKMAVSLKGSTSLSVKNTIQACKDKGFNVELIVIPANGGEYDKKLMISLMAGDEIDLINCNDFSIGKYINSGTIEPIDGLAKAAGYDMKKFYGKNLAVADGKTYGLPFSKDTWVTMYNKKIFDDAKVPYPTAKDLTWSKYVSLAKKLTDPSKGIYGSFMVEDWGQYQYMLAMQSKIPAYKADGTSNFDDPGYAKAMQFFNDLSSVDKVQPDRLTYNAKKTQFDAFMNGKYGMVVIGGWAFSAYLKDLTSHPRDWKAGVLTMPYPDGGPKTNLSLLAYRAIPKSSKHKNEAFAVSAIIAEEFYKYNSGTLPGRTDLTDAQIKDFIATQFVNDYKFDGFTADELLLAFMDKNTELVTEKIVGPGSAVIDQAFTSEGEMVAIGQKTPQAALKDIKAKADKAIAEELAAK